MILVMMMMMHVFTKNGQRQVQKKRKEKKREMEGRRNIAKKAYSCIRHIYYHPNSRRSIQTYTMWQQVASC